ncbi:MAG: hypothetical protein WBC91_01020 [Phototrophicaceae bacterium]
MSNNLKIPQMIQNLIDSKDVRLTNSTEREELVDFKHYLQSHKKLNYFLDWSNIFNVKKLDLEKSNDDDVEKFINSSVIKDYEYMVIIPVSGHKELIVAKSVVFEYFDILTSRGPIHYILGIDQNDGKIQFIMEDFLECRLDKGYWLIGRQIT